MDSYIRVLISEEIKEKFRKYSKNKGMDMSTMIRMLIIEKIGDDNVND